MNILDAISSTFFDFLIAQFNAQAHELESIDLSINADENRQKFGDLSTNAALVLAKHRTVTPQSIAQIIATYYLSPYIEKMEMAGPGFINLYFNYDAIKELGRELYERKEQFFKPHHPSNLNIDLEFVSANPTGPLHLGHGRNAIIGDVLANVLKFLGNNVTKEFYINDAGAQIAKLGQSLLVRCQQERGQDVSIPEDGYHGDYLVALAKECMEQHGSNVVNNDLEFFKTYALEHILAGIKKTLQAYGVDFNVWFSEKTLHDSGDIEHAVQILRKKGNLYEQDDALWFMSTRYGDDKDRVIKKSDGSYTYIGADIAYLLNKIERGHNKLIIILGQDHHSYVQRLKGILQALGYDATMLDVILYQLVTLKESGELTRMSKRAGRMVSLNDIITNVGKDVARFFFLNKKADAHLEFDIDLALKKSEENPVFYVQYAYVRTKSILDKAQEVLEPVGHEHCALLGHEEKLLLKKIISLRTLLATIGRNYQTHLLTYYVLDLAQSFHRYYSAHRVIDPENMQTSQGRLFMVHLVNQTLKFCFDLLGISAPEKM